MKKSLHLKHVNIQLKTIGQQSYFHNAQESDICFAIGPAGTGKTFIALAIAVDALERRQVSRIILTRPVVEAGESLGFLPGDMSQKINPYMRPLYDCLYELCGIAQSEKMIEKNIIEIAPLAYMRGRTLSNAFVILDEGQNTTTQQMKMLLTRIGLNTKLIVTGDITQIDLARNKPSGLCQAIEVLKSVEKISVNHLTSTDVLRNPIVVEVLAAYERFYSAHPSANKEALHK